MKYAIDQLASSIIDGLAEYSELTSDAMKSAVRETAKEIKQTLKETSPKNTGKYAKGWAVKEYSENSTNLHMVVHSPKHHQLTHLLEFGHATKDGGRTKAQPHLAPAEEQAIASLQKRIEERL